MFLLKLTTLSLVASLTGCGTVSTLSNKPDNFVTLSEGKFRAAEEASLVDCVLDGFSDAQNFGLNTQVRQTRRAAGYRVEVVVGPTQLMVADIHYVGDFKLSLSNNAKYINLDKEAAAAKACLTKYAVK